MRYLIIIKTKIKIIIKYSLLTNKYYIKFNIKININCKFNLLKSFNNLFFFKTKSGQTRSGKMDKILKKKNPDSQGDYGIYFF